LKSTKKSQKQKKNPNKKPQKSIKPRLIATLRTNLPYVVTLVMLQLFILPYLNEIFPFDIPVPNILIAAIASALLKIVVYAKGKNAKKYKRDEEFGSARWGTLKDIKSFIDPTPENNIILTKTEAMTMNSRLKNPEYNRNKNVLVIGGSGSGKTRFYVKPNLMQCDSIDFPVSFVVTDPKGTLLEETGRMLERKGYKIRVLNLINFEKSNGYNPFRYLRNTADLLSMVESLIANTKGERPGNQSKDFFEKAETLLFLAIFGYLWEAHPLEEQTFANAIKLLANLKISEKDMTEKCVTDCIFEEHELHNPNSFAAKQYKKFREHAAGKTALSVLISCDVRLGVFDIPEVQTLTSVDELDLDKLGGYKEKCGTTGKTKTKKQKYAVFVIVSDNDAAFNFIAALAYSQLFTRLCHAADNNFGGRLPIHVRCILDEFANLGKIPNFEKIIATIRSREISASIILQSQAQLKAIYGDFSEVIVGNCDSRIFLGGAEKTTLEEFSRMLGKQTIYKKSTSETRGMSQSFGTSESGMARELMTPDELQTMSRSNCILILSGIAPFLSKKYQLESHPNYKYLSDFKSENHFDVLHYIRKFRGRKKSQNETKNSVDLIINRYKKILNGVGENEI